MRLTRSITHLVPAALAACFMASGALAAPSDGDTVYPRDLLKQKPELAKRYNDVVKPVTDAHEWIANGGTQTPVTEVSFGNTDYAVLSSCKPHDCASQNLVVLLPSNKTKQDAAVGALVVNAGDQGLGPQRSTIRWLGEPGRDERRFLGAYLFR